MDAAYAAGVNAGLSPNLAQYMPRFVQIESGGNPNAQSGSYGGLLQMGPDEAAKYGGNGMAQGASMYADRANWFKSKYGRMPTPTELYLANQQGEGGIAAHLANPDAPAWQNMASTVEGQKKGSEWAKQAIWGNVPSDMRGLYPGGVDSLTSQQFLDLWHHKVERTPFTSAFSDARNEKMNPLQAIFSGASDPAPSSDPSYNPNAGLFDRLRAGGPGALFGAPRGIFPGANGAPGYNLGSALQKAGMFAMSANNPSALFALGQASPDRKFVPIGTDDLGNPRYGFVDSQRVTVTPVSGGTAGPGAQGNMGDTVTQALKSGKTGEDALAGVNPVIASLVRNLSGGAEPYNPGSLMRTPIGRAALALLPAYEPGATAADFAGRQSGMKDWAGGKSNEIARRAETTALHGSELADSFNALGNTSVPAWNAVKNTVSEQLGAGAPVKARMNMVALANEMGAFVRGNGGSDSSFKEWAQNFPVNGSPEQQRSSVGMLATLYSDAVGALEQKRLRSVGPVQAAKMGPILSQKAQDALAKMKSYGEGGANKLPPGVTSIQVVQ